MQVTIRVTDADGIEVVRLWGILADRSTVGPPHLEFGLDEPDSPTATFPLALDGRYRCGIASDGVRIGTAGGSILLVARDQNAPRGLTDDDHRAVASTINPWRVKP